jgi:hypothetical protein
LDNNSPHEQSNLDENLARIQGSNPSGDVKPSLRQERTVYRPIEGNPPADNNHIINPTPTPTETNQKSDHGLYKDPELFIPRVRIDRSREEFQLPEGDVGLTVHPLFDVRELEATLEAAHEEFGCAQCQSTGYLTSPDGTKIKCDCCLGDPPNMMTIRGYRYFSQLGQVVSLLKDDSERSREARHQVNELLKKTVKSEREYRDLARILHAKLENPLHNTQGIMITGLVRVVRPNNGLYGAIIGLPDSNDRITVISDQPFDFVAEDRVVLLGIVVQEPAKNITGFDANRKPWIVWHGASVTIPEPLPE